jgi:hypothetical protein
VFGEANVQSCLEAAEDLMGGNGQMIFVSAEGTYATVQAAIDAIADAGPSKWYVVVAPPGDNAEAISLAGKGYICLAGSGDGATRLTGSLTLPVATLPCAIRDLVVDGAMLEACQRHPLCRWDLIDGEGYRRSRSAFPITFALVPFTADVTVGTLDKWRVPEDLDGIVLRSVVLHHTGTPSGISGVTSLGIERTRSGGAVELLSTEVTIDHGEADSTTAATPAVIDPTYKVLHAGDVLAFVTTALPGGTAPKGLAVTLGWW